MKNKDKDLVDMNKLEYVYQPLWNITNWRVYGYEGLLRTQLDEVFKPEDLFHQARLEGTLFEIEICLIKNYISNYPLFRTKPELLFLNIFPSSLLHPEFECFIEELLKEHPYISGRIVFEINETMEEYHTWQVPELKEKVSLLKEKGFYVALDDVGKGAASLQNIVEYKPNYIKFDKYFSQELASNKEKQALISFFTDYCDENMIFILEGIERDIDLAQAKLLNVPIAQGYLLGEPKQL
ncbi:EAL domain-containing protein [Bacillus sp. CECT 9360]|uniref:EAL domain-containing protein n=1 Tax=Bacillus sp. CECT 9360 TaxID=2845821 RepID=UPI001E3D78C7|nr:EAL domain-containing protein [Bacillus sp. CECT 9360]CAH0346416.1 putative cyclic di-GMP phosphodiesterase PdeI [Bacillus sp. CECT 9360]